MARKCIAEGGARYGLAAFGEGARFRLAFPSARSLIRYFVEGYRKGRVQDVRDGLSDMPHVIVNQARLGDFLLEVARNSPSRLRPDYGHGAVAVQAPKSDDDPVVVTIRRLDGSETTVKAKYVVGCDGAHSTVRESIGGDRPDAWLTADEVLDKARRVLAPYTLEVQEIAWFSVYRVGHTVTDKFDDVDDKDVGKRSPRDELMLEGNGTGEVRAWVAVAGAMHGHPGTTLAYEPVYEWINGMGVVIVCRRSPIHGPRSSGHTRTAESEIWAASIKFD